MFGFAFLLGPPLLPFPLSLLLPLPLAAVRSLVVRVAAGVSFPAVPQPLRRPLATRLRGSSSIFASISGCRGRTSAYFLLCFSSVVLELALLQLTIFWPVGETGKLEKDLCVLPEIKAEKLILFIRKCGRVWSNSQKKAKFESKNVLMG